MKITREALDKIFREFDQQFRTAYGAPDKLIVPPKVASAVQQVMRAPAPSRPPGEPESIVCRRCGAEAFARPKGGRKKRRERDVFLHECACGRWCATGGPKNAARGEVCHGCNQGSTRRKRELRKRRNSSSGPSADRVG